MATNTPAEINGSDPTVLRQIERQNSALQARVATPPSVSGTGGANTTTTAGAVRNLAPIVSGSETLYPQSTTATSSSAVTINSSINNDTGDITTVYSTNGRITVNPINQTINQYTAVDSGVSQIVAGNGITISSTGNSGTGVVTVSSSTAFGNIVNVNLNGNANSVLRGDGTWGADANSSYGNSNVAAYLPTYTGNVGASNVNVTGTVYSNGISSTGLASLTTLNVGATANLGAVGNVIITGGTSGQKLTTDGAGNLSWTNDANSSYGDSNVVSLLSAFGSNTITTTGNVSVGNIIGNGQALTNIAGANVSGFVPNANVANTAFAVAAANVSGLGNIATLNLTGSTSNVLYGNGVFAAVAGGNANTGNVTFDDVTVQGVNGLNLSAGADFTANLAYLQVRAGDVASHIHLDTGNNQAYDLIVGDDQNYVQVSSTGNILLSAYDSNTSQYTWTLDYNGNLILAGGNSVIQSIANSSLDPTLPNVSTMVLTPDANYNSQVLVLDPTAPGHIHLRAYAFSNIDDPAANIFLGGEDTAFEITSGANNQAVIHSNGKAWTFGNDGNISSDTLTFTTTFANVKTVEYQTAGVWDLYVEDDITGSNTAISRLNVSFKDNLIDKPQVYIENTKESDGIALRWTFDENGNLNFPRDVVGNTDPYLNIFGGSTPTIQSTDVSLAGPANLAIQADYLNYSGFNGNRIVLHADTGEVATDANMVLTTNLANTGNTYSWTFGDDGRLTFPGTPRIDTDANNFEVQAAEAINFEANTVVNIYTDTGNTTYQWQFGDDGVLTVPGNLAYIGASPAPSISGFDSANFAGNVTGGNISTTGNISGNTNGYTIGYLNVPQVSASNATLALGDEGKHYYSTTAGNLTLTIPTNANVAFATGTAISIVVQAAGNLLVNAASGVTLYMAGNSSAANRVVGGYGMATLLKVASDTWFINGTGVS